MSSLKIDFADEKIAVDDFISGGSVRQLIQIEWVRQVIYLAKECNDTIQLIASIDIDTLDAAETYFNLGGDCGGGDVLGSAAVGLQCLREDINRRVRETQAP